MLLGIDRHFDREFRRVAAARDEAGRSGRGDDAGVAPRSGRMLQLSFRASFRCAERKIRDDRQAPFSAARAGFLGARRPGCLSRPASRRLLLTLLSDPPRGDPLPGLEAAGGRA